MGRRDAGAAAEATHWRQRLYDGLAHNINLVIAKALLGATAAGVPTADLVRDALLYGAAHRDRWGLGLTTLMAVADLLPVLDEEDRFLALFHGIAAVAEDCDGEPSRVDSEPLGGDVPLTTLARWLRHWVRVRHRSGAERTLRTAIASGAPPQWLAGAMLTAVTDRHFADGGHALDFLDKAFAGVDLVGWNRADALLPSIIPVLTASVGSEERDSCRHPVDLIGLTEQALPDLRKALAAGRMQRGKFQEHLALGRLVLGEDPEAVIAALLNALRNGATPTDVARAVAVAAALRITHFGTANDHSDWESAHHTFSYANAACSLIARATENGVDVETEALCLRAVLQGALAVYLNRYLNVPPARLPSGEDSVQMTPAELRRAFLDACDRQHQVAQAGRLAAHHLAADYPAADLIALLGHALVREDAGFHMVQNLQAPVQQYTAWQGDQETSPILIAAARYLAAHCPTSRSSYQTAQVPVASWGGGAVHEDQGTS